MENIIHVSKISKKYDTLNLKDITFKINTGEIIAVLGANGSGKTTLLKMLSTSIKPDSGTIKYNLSNGSKTIQDARKQIGVLFETPSLYGCMTISENLDFFADLYNIDKSQKYESINASLDLSGISDCKDFIVDSLSYGLKRRADISRVFVTNPKLIILDEPFKGLDAKTISNLKKQFKEYSEAGTTIIFSTNNIEDVRHIVTKAIFLHENQFYFYNINKILELYVSKNR